MISERECEEISFRNLVYWFYDELVHVYRHRRYPKTLSNHQKHRLSRFGVTMRRKNGSHGYMVRLTPEAERVLDELESEKGVE